MGAPALSLKSVRIDLDGAPLIEGLDLALPAGAFACLLGRSGAGKSTLLRAIAGLQALTAGRIEGAVPCAFMAQQDGLLPWGDAVSNVTLGTRLRGERADRARALTLLSETGLDGHMQKRPAELSGGMRQRVALARTLYEDRGLVLLDEPFGAVDSLTRIGLHALTKRLLAGRTVVMVTHDPWEALALGTHVAVLAGAPARITHVEALHPGEPKRAIHARLMAALGPEGGAP